MSKFPRLFNRKESVTITVSVIVVMLAFSIIAYAAPGDVRLGANPAQFTGDVVVSGKGTFDSVEQTYPSGSYTYMIYSYVSGGTTYYAARHSNGTIINSWTSTNANTVCTNAINTITDAGTIYFKNGLYTNMSIVITDKQIQLIGESRAGVILRGNGAGSITLTISNTYLIPSRGGQGFQRLTIDNLYGTGTGVFLRNATYCIFSDFTVTNCNEGLRLSGSLVNTFTGYFIGHSVIGVSLIGDNPNGCNANRFFGGEIGANTQHNVDIEGGGYEVSGNTFNGVTFEGAQDVVVQINSDTSIAEGNQFINCWIEVLNDGTPIVFNEATTGTYNSSNNLYSGNKIVCNSTFYALINKGNGAKFINNELYPIGAITVNVIFNGARNLCSGNSLREPYGESVLYIGTVGTGNVVENNTPNN